MFSLCLSAPAQETLIYTIFVECLENYTTTNISVWERRILSTISDSVIIFDYTCIVLCFYILIIFPLISMRQFSPTYQLWSVKANMCFIPDTWSQPPAFIKLPNPLRPALLHRHSDCSVAISPNQRRHILLPWLYLPWMSTASSMSRLIIS